MTSLLSALSRLPHAGAIRQADGTVQWRVWSPRAQDIQLVLGTGAVHPLPRQGDWFALRLEGIEEGTRYAFRIKGQDLPDPASRWQPDGVQAPSAVFTPGRYQWNDQGWTGVARADLAIYELHVGTFTPAGTFSAIIERLPDLKSLGITALEIMPVGQFPGARNWGYDGVLPFAVQNSYGGPRAFQEFIDAAHQAGLAVLLDVVYNHFGPEGNSLNCFGPYFTEAYRTPWGPAVNYDGPDSDPVRAFILDNVRMWIEEFHLDGLRLDAVHAIYDLGARHLLAEIQETAQSIAAAQGRTVHVIAESDQSDPRLVDPPEQNGLGLDGVWADDLHHGIRALIAGDRQGYFSDFGRTADLAKAYNDVFVYDGRYSPHRRRRHGAPVGDRDRRQFVVCIHNHDQVGNRALGDRSASYLPRPAQRLACGLLMLSPCLPLIFMGEEYAEERPFPFFCSFQDAELIAAVRRGRREEFAALGFEWEDRLPDPQAEETFESAKLAWRWSEDEFSGQLRRLYQDLLKARRDWPALRGQYTHARALEVSPNTEDSRWLLAERGTVDSILAIANLSAEGRPMPGIPLGERSPLFSTEAARYGGARQSLNSVHDLLPLELLLFGTPHV